MLADRQDTSARSSSLLSSLLDGKVTGAHVLVRRGGCSFFAKALAVSDAGGFAMILINEGPGRFTMEAEPGQHVDIPVVLVTKMDGEQHLVGRRRPQHVWHTCPATQILFCFGRP